MGKFNDYAWGAFEALSYALSLLEDLEPEAVRQELNARIKDLIRGVSVDFKKFVLFEFDYAM